VPWPTPSFTWRDRVGQGAGPAGAGEAAGVVAWAAGADVAGAEVAALLADGALPLAVVLEELPHPVARAAAQLSTTAGNARRARSRVEFITIPLTVEAP
jgi:hypothetical protein